MKLFANTIDVRGQPGGYRSTESSQSTLVLAPPSETQNTGVQLLTLFLQNISIAIVFYSCAFYFQIDTGSMRAF
jgi:hypothetical protein